MSAGLQDPATMSTEDVPAIGGGLISKLVRKVTPMRKKRRERADSNFGSQAASANDRVLIDELSPR